MSDLAFLSQVMNNFKCFQGKHTFILDRPPGLYYMAGRNRVVPRMGANGVGKTTVWDGLMWCLWGKTGRDKKPGSAIEPWEAEGEECWVEVYFKRFGKKQSIRRGRNPSELLHITKDRVLSIPQAEIPNIVGMSEGMFRRSIVLSQFGSLFLDLGPEKQSQMFNEALNLELWLKAATLAGRKLKDCNRRLVGLKIEASRLDGRARELEASLASERKARDDYDESVHTNQKRLAKKAQAKEDEISTLVGELSLGRSSTEKDPKEEVEASIEALEESLREANLGHTILSNESATTNSKLADLVDRKTEYENSRALGSTCPDCGQRVDKQHLDEKIAMVERRITKRQRQADTHREGLLELETKQERLREKLKERRRVLNQLTELQAELRSLNRERNSLVVNQDNPHVAAVRDLRGRLKNIRGDHAVLEEEQTKLEQVAARCEFWSMSFKEIRLGLIDHVLSELEVVDSQHAERLGLTDCRIEFQTERVKASGDISTVFSSLLYMPDRDEPVKWENYSGGESQRWQLAVAFGLSELLLERCGVAPNIEVLDEPTKGMSPEGVEDLLEHLRERALELGRAIYVTEHHSLERGLFDGTIVVERTKDGHFIKE